MEGKKFDDNKVMAGLMVHDFSRALMAVSEVTTFGANKYAPSNWLKVDNAESRYRDALYRHLFAHDSGESNDSESGLSHLSHACWNCLALLQLGLTGPERISLEMLANVYGSRLNHL